jgi:hypothetical protein
VADDLRLDAGAVGAYHLDAGAGVLACAPGDPADLEWQRVLLDSVLITASLARGFQALHAGAVEIDGRLVAVAAPSGGGKSTLVGELLDGGGRLLADDVVALAPSGRGGAVLAHPAPPVMNVALSGPGRPPEDLGTVLGHLGDEAWVLADRTTHEPRRLDCLVILERVAGAAARAVIEPANAVELLAHGLESGSESDRLRARFELFADLARDLRVVRLAADAATEPAALAAAVRGAIA